MLARHALQPRNQIHGLVELQVVLERRRMQLDLAVAQHVVQQVLDFVLPQQRGIQLDADVTPHLDQQESDDAFDLARPGSRGKWTG